MGMAENLRRIRKERKLSQVQLAEKSGVSQQLISQIEGGKNTSTKKLPELAAALDVAIHDIDPHYFSLSDEGREELLQKLRDVLGANNEDELRMLDVHLETLLSFRRKRDGNT